MKHAKLKKELFDHGLLLLWVGMILWNVYQWHHLAILVGNGLLLVFLMITYPLVHAYGYNAFFRRAGEPPKKPSWRGALREDTPWLIVIVGLGLLLHYKSGVCW